MHKFNPANKDKLDSEERKKSLPPKDVLERFGLERGATVADIGAGTGYFSLPAVEMVGEKGFVYALDISDEMLAALRKKAESRGINSNLELIKSDEHGAELTKVVDFILISNVVHEVKDKDKFFSNYLANLKPGGKVAIIEWKKAEMEVGPPVQIRIFPEELASLLSDYGLETKEKIDISEKYYSLIAKKKTRD